MARTFIGFYDMDASPSRGITGELATRLGGATETDGFVDGALYARSDHAGVAIVVRFEEHADGWEREGSVATLLQAADWRSRSGNGRLYRLVGRIDGDGATANDASFVVVQRFGATEDTQDAIAAAVRSYFTEYASGIHGFIEGTIYASVDRTSVAFFMSWAHEAALGALENRDGSLAAMQTHLRLATSHAFASYQRVSYLRTPGWTLEEPAAPSLASSRPTVT